MVARANNYPEAQYLTAMGYARFADSGNAVISAPDGTPWQPFGLQTAKPLTGATVAMNDDSSSSTLYLTPAGTIAALTVNFPSDANCAIGTVRRIMTTQTITALTLAQAGGGGVFTGAAVTTLAQNAVALFQKVAANTWAHV